MTVTTNQPLVMDERRLSPSSGDHPERAAERATDLVRDRRLRNPGLLGWTVHLAVDRLRILTTEIWADGNAAATTLAAADRSGVGRDARLYRHVASTGAPIEPSNADLTAAGHDTGVLIVDRIPVPHLLTRPVAAFTARNGRAFAQQPGCLGTTVWRSTPGGRVATYARWQSEQHFLNAFTATQGTRVSSLAEIDATAARITRGLIRTDYRRYDLVAAENPGDVGIGGLR